MTAPRDDDRIPAWRRYLRLTRDDPARDVDDELAFHIQSAIDEYIASGMTADEAQAAARRRFGDYARITKTLYTLSERRERGMDRKEWLHSIWQDVLFGARQLRKSPGFTLVALLTLALGIGANSAIYSVVHTVLLKPLPYANAERVLRIHERYEGRDIEATFGNYAAWKAQSQSFAALGATWGSNPVTLTGVGDPLPINTTRATASFFRAMNIRPLAGRYFDETEDKEGAAPVVIISAALWRDAFGGDPNIVGKTIMLSGTARTVVGVAPQDYVLTPPANRVWVPLFISAARAGDHSDHELKVYGLVKPGIPLDAAAAEVARIQRQLAQEFPDEKIGDVRASRLLDSVVGDQRTMLYTLFGAVMLVLLIGCANVANLLLARGARRRAEMAVRGALGASRSRIIRQLLIESLLLGTAGGLLGLGVAYAGIRFLVTSPAALPRLRETTLDPRVVAFTLMLSIGCAVLFGLVPALRAARTDLQQTLREGGRDSGPNAKDGMRVLLVVGELCLAQVLLVGAALLIRSAMLMSAVPIGFDTRNLIAFSISLPPARYQTSPQIDEAFRRIEEAVAAIPGVSSAGRAQVVPIYGSGWSWNAMREGSNGNDAGAIGADMRGVSPNYFATLGVPLVRGRAFTNADGPDGARVAIVSRSLGRKLFGDADPIGHRISNGSPERPLWREIVGVADDIHSNGPGEDVRLTMYMPSSDFVNGGQTIIVRGKVPVLGLVPELRRAVASVDPLLALSNVSTLEQSLSELLAVQRFTMMLLSLLGGAGLVLAIVGVYGVISYFVTLRTKELGVRIALGASAPAVRWLVVRQGLVFALAGMTIGGVMALGAARLLRSMVFGITPHDPLTFVGVGLVLGAVAVAASYIPARRATRIDPLQALRS